MPITREALSIFLNQPNYAIVKCANDVYLSYFKDKKFVYIGDVEASLEGFDLKSLGLLGDEEFFLLEVDEAGKPIRNKAIFKHFNKMAKKEEKTEKKQIKEGAYSQLIREAVKFPTQHDIYFIAAGSSNKERDSYLNRLVNDTAMFSNGKLRITDDWYAVPFIEVNVGLGLKIDSQVRYALMHKKLLGKKAIRLVSYLELLETLSKYHLQLLDRPKEKKQKHDNTYAKAA